MSPVLKDPKDAPKADSRSQAYLARFFAACSPAFEVNDADMVRGALSIVRDPSYPRP